MKTKKMLLMVILGSMMISQTCFGEQTPTWKERARLAAPTLGVIAGLAALGTAAYYYIYGGKKKKTDFLDITGLDESTLGFYRSSELLEGLEAVINNTSITALEAKNFRDTIADAILDGFEQSESNLDDILASLDEKSVDYRLWSFIRDRFRERQLKNR